MASAWKQEQDKLREILVGSKLTEQKKWGKPCFCHGDKNIAIFQPMKEHLSLMFFKGEILKDPKGVLVPVGPNSHFARRILITDVAQVEKLKGAIKALVKEAIAVEEAGIKIEKPKAALDLAPELAVRIRKDKAFKAAFSSLTPGRQREYNLFISGAKQAATRESRLEKLAPKILAGKGMREV